MILAQNIRSVDFFCSHHIISLISRHGEYVVSLKLNDEIEQLISDRANAQYLVIIFTVFNSTLLKRLVLYNNKSFFTEVNVQIKVNVKQNIFAIGILNFIFINDSPSQCGIECD